MDGILKEVSKHLHRTADYLEKMENELNEKGLDTLAREYGEKAVNAINDTVNDIEGAIDDVDRKVGVSARGKEFMEHADADLKDIASDVEMALDAGVEESKALIRKAARSIKGIMEDLEKI